MANEARVRIGLLGAGYLGSYVLKRAQGERRIQVVCVYDPDASRTRALPPQVVLASPDEFAARDVDLVLEVATSNALKGAACEILEACDLIPCSLTAFAEEAFNERVVAAQSRSGHRVFVPHGAIGGLDAISDGRDLIDQVTITTTKHPRNIEGCADPEAPGQRLLFEGTTREACRRFPRNVNVHAGVALVGLGFDRTISKLSADPSVSTMQHCVSVRGKGIHWELTFSSEVGGGVSGSYTPESIYRTVLRVALRRDVPQLPLL